MTMIDDSDLKRLAGIDIPAASPRAKADALAAAMQAFEQEKAAPQAQGTPARPRLSDRAKNLWSMMMKPRLMTSSALAVLIAAPIGGYAALQLMRERPILQVPTAELARSDDEALRSAPAKPVSPIGNALDGKIGSEPANAAKPVAAQEATPQPTANEQTAESTVKMEQPRIVPPQPETTENQETDSSKPTDQEIADLLEVHRLTEQPPVMPGGPLAGSSNGEFSFGLSSRDGQSASDTSARTANSAPAPVDKRQLRTGIGTETELGTLSGQTEIASKPKAQEPDAQAAQMEYVTKNNADFARRLKEEQAKARAANGMVGMPSGQPEGVIASAQPATVDRDRVETFASNSMQSVASQPVSTFSIDADTASYSLVRRSLNAGQMPNPETVRVEEMVNYFPYDWKGPESRETPFKPTVTVMPTPWNTHTKLMHVAIKGYDTPRTQQPKANLVYLIDVSGSMREPDKLPLLQNAFRMQVNALRPDDTVSIVTYAGQAGVALEPTKVADKRRILDAIDGLSAGGSTAGAAGIEEAYHLAEQSFMKDGVNRVMLATDGDFNVGQTSDDELQKLIEEKRKSGVYLSVLGFGQGNLNDELMQTIAQNGNGQAAYVDTLQEAQKALVDEASATLFPIAKDVKIQVEFNPATISEYRLVGYETRALAREDFNNDKVDAGEIGSGHAVTAIYEITPKGSPAQLADDLRYKVEAPAAEVSNAADPNEYAFVKIRYKLPGETVSKLITQPVTPANEVASFDAAGNDQRFSVAVAAFGQKLRHENGLDDFGYDRVLNIASATKGQDLFGYRAEFLSLVRLAQSLDGGAEPASARQQ